MKILFCNIAFMKYYRGVIEGVDEPVNLCVRTKDLSQVQEQFNFLPCDMEDRRVCLGFFSAKNAGGSKSGQVHIEEMQGVSEEDSVVEHVLVVWCAKKEGNDNRTVVVGWYKDATVYRYYQEAVFGEGEEEYHQLYNVVADAENCVLLPVGERSRYTRWNIPRKKGSTGPAFGFGTSTVWFAQEEKAEQFIKDLAARIDGYYEDNLMDAEIQ